MARSFSSKEAKQLIRSHQSMLEQLRSSINHLDTVRKDCNALAGSMVTLGAFARHAAGELLSGSIRDTLPPDVQRLILRLHRYRQGKLLSAASLQLLQENRPTIEEDLAHLKPAASGMQWLFAGKQKKALAEDAYERLLSAANGTYAQGIRSITEGLAQAEHADTEQALESFALNRSSFRDALLEISPDIFTAGRLIPEADRIVRSHQALLEDMDSAEHIIDTRRKEITDAVSRMQDIQVMSLLQEIPVEELGREKTGIRFKSLHDAGYGTVSDIYHASVPAIEAVNGISGETAYLLKQYARQYAEQARSGTRIRLSVDAQSPESTGLVTAIYRYRQHASACDALETLQGKNRKTVTQGIRCMQDIGSGAAWVFAEPEEKQHLIDAYRCLADLLNGDYGRDIRSLLDQLAYPAAASPSQIWADFARSNIAYFNTLESVVPGVLGSDDTHFGLPEDLARAISEEPFYPDGLRCSLRRYQEWGVKYILHQGRVLLGDEMGLGKTIQAIASMVSLRNTGATHFLVVCPASVIPNWCKEVAEKSNLRVTKIHGADRDNAFRDWLAKGGVAVTNFETTGHLQMGEDFSFDMIIVDEAHYIKNTEARRTQNTIRICEHTGRILFMTGTALENRVDEMIALVQILQPVIASQLHHIAFMASAPQFREKVAPVYYRRRREDVLTELPELIESKEWCSMSPEETDIYESTVLQGHFMTARRVSWNMADLHDSCKAARMEEIMEDAAEDGRKIIVFSFFRETIEKIRDFLGPRCLPPVTGSIPPQRRQEIIDEFNDAPAGAVLLAQIQAGGTGLNIQAASVVIMCEPQLKPSIENQAVSRAYRMGQARNVLVYRLLCEDSIDERITEMLAEKQTVFDTFADESVSAEATAKEEVALDETTMGKIMQEEIDRIHAKNRPA